MAVVSFWIPKIREIKKKMKLKGFSELKKVFVNEAKSTLLEDVHEIYEIRNYLKER